MYKKLNIYYPNKWKENIKDLVPKEDIDFNWFICSKVYIDPETGSKVAEISGKTKFYEEKTGNTFVLNPDLEKVIVAIDGTDPKGKYQGYAIQKCKNSQGFICKDVTFYILENAVKQHKNEECEIILFAQKNYKKIKKIYPAFPTQKEIDEALKKYPSGKVCKVLNDYISSYFTKKKV